MDYAKKSLEMHYELKGKIEIAPRAQADTREALSLAYTPGVAAPCLEIQKDVNKSYELTRRWNTVAVVTDGTAVLCPSWRGSACCLRNSAALTPFRCAFAARTLTR